MATSVKGRRVAEILPVQKGSMPAGLYHDSLKGLQTALNGVADARYMLQRAEGRLETASNTQPTSPHVNNSKLKNRSKQNSNLSVPVDSIPSMEINSSSVLNYRRRERQSKTRRRHMQMQDDQSNLNVRSPSTLHSTRTIYTSQRQTPMGESHDRILSRDVLLGGYADNRSDVSTEVRVLNDIPTTYDDSEYKEPTVELSPGLRVNRNYIPTYERLFGSDTLTRLSEAHSKKPESSENKELTFNVKQPHVDNETDSHVAQSHIERLREKVERQRIEYMRRNTIFEGLRKSNHLESDPISVTEDGNDRLGVPDDAKPITRKVARAPPPPPPHYRGFNMPITKYQLADGKVVSDDHLRKNSKTQKDKKVSKDKQKQPERISDVKPLQPSKNQTSNQQNIPSSKVSKPSRKVHRKTTLPKERPRRPDTITAQTWREGHKAVLKVLGPPPKVEKAGRIHSPPTRDIDPFSSDLDPSGASEPVSPKETGGREYSDGVSDGHHSDDSNLNQNRDESDKLIKESDKLSSEAKGVLDDLHLDSDDSHVSDVKPPKESKPPSGINERKPPTGKESLMEEVTTSLPAKKVRHYDSSEVRKYMTEQKTRRKKKQLEERRRREDAEIKKQEQLQDLYKRQKESAKSAPRGGVNTEGNPDIGVTFNKGMPQQNIQAEIRRQVPRTQTKRKLDVTGSDKENKAFYSTSSSDTSSRSSPQTDISNGVVIPHPIIEVIREGEGDVELIPVTDQDAPISMTLKSKVLPSLVEETGPAEGEQLNGRSERDEKNNVDTNIVSTSSQSARNKSDRIRALQATATALQGRLDNEVRKLAGDLSGIKGSGGQDFANRQSASVGDNSVLKKPLTLSGEMPDQFSIHKPTLSKANLPSRTFKSLSLQRNSPDAYDSSRWAYDVYPREVIPSVRLSTRAPQDTPDLSDYRTRQERLLGNGDDYNVFTGSLPGVSSLSRQAKAATLNRQRSEAATIIQAAFRGHSTRQKFNWKLPSGLSLGDHIKGKSQRDEHLRPRDGDEKNNSDEDGEMEDVMTISEGPISETSSVEDDEDRHRQFQELVSCHDHQSMYPPISTQGDESPHAELSIPQSISNILQTPSAFEPTNDGLSVIDIFTRRYQQAQRNLIAARSTKQNNNDITSVAPNSVRGHFTRPGSSPADIGGGQRVHLHEPTNHNLHRPTSLTNHLDHYTDHHRGPSERPTSIDGYSEDDFHSSDTIGSKRSDLAARSPSGAKSDLDVSSHLHTHSETLHTGESFSKESSVKPDPKRQNAQSPDNTEVDISLEYTSKNEESRDKKDRIQLHHENSLSAKTSHSSRGTGSTSRGTGSTSTASISATLSDLPPHSTTHSRSAQSPVTRRKVHLQKLRSPVSLPLSPENERPRLRRSPLSDPGRSTLLDMRRSPLGSASHSISSSEDEGPHARHRTRRRRTKRSPLHRKSSASPEVPNNFRPISRPPVTEAAMSSNPASKPLHDAVTNGPHMVGYSPGTLGLKMTAELNLLDMLDASAQQMAEMEHARTMSLAHQESASLAQILQARQRDHERELQLLSLKAQQEVHDANRQLEEVRQRVASTALEADKMMMLAKKEAAESRRGAADKLLQTQAEASRITAEAAKKLAEVHEAAMNQPPPPPAIEPGRLAAESAQAAALAATSAVVSAAFEQQRLHQLELLREVQNQYRSPPPVRRSMGVGDYHVTSPVGRYTSPAQTVSAQYTEDFSPAASQSFESRTSLNLSSPESQSSARTSTRGSPSRGSPPQATSPHASPPRELVSSTQNSPPQISTSSERTRGLKNNATPTSNQQVSQSVVNTIPDEFSKQEVHTASIETEPSLRSELNTSRQKSIDSIGTTKSHSIRSLEDLDGRAGSDSISFEESASDADSILDTSDQVSSKKRSTNQPTAKEHVPTNETVGKSVPVSTAASQPVRPLVTPPSLNPRSTVILNDTFSDFSVELIRQQLRDEEMRAQQQVALLNLRESAMVDKTQAELQWLEHEKRQMKEAKDLAGLAIVRKKQRELVAKMKQDQEDIKQLRAAQLASSQERHRLLRQQEEVARLQQSAQLLKDRNQNLPPISPHLTSFEGHMSSTESSLDIPVDALRGSGVGFSPASQPKMDSSAEGGSLTPAEKQAKVMHRLKVMQEPLNIRFLSKRAMKLKRRRKEAEDLLAWKQRLDREEDEVSRLELKIRNIDAPPRKVTPKPPESGSAKILSSSPRLNNSALSGGKDESRNSSKDGTKSSVSSREKSKRSSHSSEISEQIDVRTADKDILSVSDMSMKSEGVPEESQTSILEDLSQASSLPEEIASGNSENKSKKSLSFSPSHNSSSDETVKDASHIEEYANESFDSVDKTTTPSKATSVPPKQVPVESSRVPHPRLRKRHESESGSESEKSYSQTLSETTSDQSDIEGRIRALKDSLRKRKVEADRLRKQQKRLYREKLKVQEASLKKQLETYDTFIEQTRADLLAEETHPSSHITAAAKPQIKQPSISETQRRRDQSHTRALRQRTASESSMEGNVELHGGVRGVSLAESRRSSRSSLEDENLAGVKETREPVVLSKEPKTSEVSSLKPTSPHYAETSVLSRSLSGESSITEDLSVRSLDDLSAGESSPALSRKSFSPKQERKDLSISSKHDKDTQKDKTTYVDSNHVSAKETEGEERKETGKGDAEENSTSVSRSTDELPSEESTRSSRSVTSASKKINLAGVQIDNKAFEGENDKSELLVKSSIPPSQLVQESISNMSDGGSKRSEHVDDFFRRKVETSPVSDSHDKMVSPAHPQEEKDAVDKSEGSYSEDFFESSVSIHVGSKKEEEKPVDTDEDISEHLSETSQRSSGSGKSQSSEKMMINLSTPVVEVEPEEESVHLKEDEEKDDVEEEEDELGNDETSSKLDFDNMEAYDVKIVKEPEEDLMDPFRNLAVGDRVLLGDDKPGTLRFKGLTDFAAGHWGGIELDEPQGTNDGSYLNKQYFTCSFGHGIFAPAEKITPFCDEQIVVHSLSQSSITEEIFSEASEHTASERSDEDGPSSLSNKIRDKSGGLKDGDLDLLKSEISFAKSDVLERFDDTDEESIKEEVFDGLTDDAELQKVISHTACAVESFSVEREVGDGETTNYDTPRGAPEEEEVEEELEDAAGESPRSDTNLSEDQHDDEKILQVRNHDEVTEEEELAPEDIPSASKDIQEMMKPSAGFLKMIVFDDKEDVKSDFSSSPSPRKVREELREEQDDAAQMQKEEEIDARIETVLTTLLHKAIDDVIQIKKNREEEGPADKNVENEEDARDGKSEEEEKHLETNLEAEEKDSERNIGVEKVTDVRREVQPEYPKELDDKNQFDAGKTRKQDSDGAGFGFSDLDTPLTDELFINEVKVESAILGLRDSDDVTPRARPTSPVFGESGSISPQALSEKLSALQSLDHDIFEADLFGGQEWFDDDFRSMPKSNSIIKVPVRGGSQEAGARSLSPEEIPKYGENKQLDLKKLVEEPFMAVPHNTKDVTDIASKAVRIFHQNTLNGELEDVTSPPSDILGSDTRGSDIESTSRRAYKTLMFDISREMYKSVVSEQEPVIQPPWMKPKRKPRKFFIKDPPKNIDDISAIVKDQILKTSGLVRPQAPVFYSKYATRKKRDTVDEILIQELREEEQEWVDYDDDELSVKMQLSDAILTSLLSETASILQEIQEKRGSHEQEDSYNSDIEF